MRRLLLAVSLVAGLLTVDGGGVAHAAAQLQVRYYTNGVLANGGSLDVGFTDEGSSFRFFLTLANIGDANLHIDTITLPAGFSAALPLPSNTDVGGGATTSVWIRCDAAAAGDYSGTLHIPTSIGDFDATLTCHVTNNVGTPGMLVSAAGGPNVLDGTGEITVAPGSGQLFWVYNVGGAVRPLNLLDPQTSPASDSSFLVADSRVAYGGIPVYFYVNCRDENAQPISGDLLVSVYVTSWDDVYTFTVHCAVSDGGSLGDVPTGSGLTMWGSALAALLLGGGTMLMFAGRRRAVLR